MTVDPSEIAETLGLPDPVPNTVQYRQWARWINDALLVLRIGDGDHQGFGTGLATLDQDVVDYVVIQAVAAMVRRPDDATQVDVVVDDGRVSRTYSTSQGRVFIRDEWWSMLADEDGDSFSIGPC